MPQRPNILWLCSDQQRFDTIHALGNDYIDTPNIDKLCAEGTAFTCAYAQNPVCTPSRASFMTGKYPSAINENILGNKGVPEHCHLISKVLADAGYHCGNIGKLHLSAAWEGWEERCDDGYAEYYFNHESGLDFDAYGNAYSAWLKSKGYRWEDLFVPTTVSGKYKEDAPVELRQTAWCAETAIDFIRRNNNGTPWMLTVNCFDPHPPYDAPKSYVDKYLERGIPDPIYSDTDPALFESLSRAYHQSKPPVAPNKNIRRIRASYYGMCEIIDMHFGRIIDELDRLGLRENTIIIYTSDHGEMLGDHGITHKGCRFYEHAVRVPLIFSWKSHIKEGQRISDLTELTDIVPTLAEIIGLDCYGDAHGHTLTPKLGLSDDEPYVRDFVRCEYYNSCRGNENSFPTFATMLRDKRFKLIDYHGIETGELYDLENDPEERHNLWFDEKYSGVRFNMLKRSFDLAAVMQRPGQVRIGRY